MIDAFNSKEKVVWQKCLSARAGHVPTFLYVSLTVTVKKEKNQVAV